MLCENLVAVFGAAKVRIIFLITVRMSLIILLIISLQTCFDGRVFDVVTRGVGGGGRWSLRTVAFKVQSVDGLAPRIGDYGDGFVEIAATAVSTIKRYLDNAFLARFDRLPSVVGDSASTICGDVLHHQWSVACIPELIGDGDLPRTLQRASIMAALGELNICSVACRLALGEAGKAYQADKKCERCLQSEESFRHGSYIDGSAIVSVGDDEEV